MVCNAPAVRFFSSSLIYTTITTKDIKLELVEAKRRTRDRRKKQQLNDEWWIYDDNGGNNNDEWDKDQKIS